MNLKSLFGYQLALCGRNMKRMADDVLENYSLTTSQWSVLKLLSEKGSMTQNEIAMELESDKATVGQVIKLLEKKHFIMKCVSETDRRATEIHLKREIESQIPDIGRKLMDMTNKALSGVSEVEYHEFMRIMNIINHNLKENLYELES